MTMTAQAAIANVGK